MSIGLILEDNIHLNEYPNKYKLPVNFNVMIFKPRQPTFAELQRDWQLAAIAKARKRYREVMQGITWDEWVSERYAGYGVIATMGDLRDWLRRNFGRRFESAVGGGHHEIIKVAVTGITEAEKQSLRDASPFNVDFKFYESRQAIMDDLKSRIDAFAKRIGQ